jgi:hypothetical protein
VHAVGSCSGNPSSRHDRDGVCGRRRHARGGGDACSVAPTSITHDNSASVSVGVGEATPAPHG